MQLELSGEKNEKTVHFCIFQCKNAETPKIWSCCGKLTDYSGACILYAGRLRACFDHEFTVDESLLILITLQVMFDSDSRY